MLANSYDACVEPWKAQLLTQRARRMGFVGPDLEDAQQDIILEVIAFEFDGQRSNGASEVTALRMLIDRRLSGLRRAKQRYEKILERQTPPSDGMPVEEDSDRDLALDVQSATAAMPREERSVCEDLSLGRSISEIAQRQGCNWHTVRRRVKNIQQRFEALGLSGA